MRTNTRTPLLASLILAAFVPWACSDDREPATHATRGAGSSLLAVAAAGPSGRPVHADQAVPPAAEVPEGAHPPLYDDLGDHHVSVTTSEAEAQAYFDQGLRLHYGFNHAEAIRSYRAALDVDPRCAMCWWGIALAAGPNINGGMDAAGARLAYEAIGEAAARIEGVSPLEHALIEALSERYEADGSADRAALDSAYANAMERVVEAFPREPEALTLHAAALMNLSPWFYWEGPYDDRVPRPGTRRIVSALEDALAIDPDHPGACHYLIHAVEAAFPERALECAERLAWLMPGAGHIVHMPGHIYIRVGRYRDAVEMNRHAVHEDETFIADQGQRSVYTGAYYPHNYHFMAFAATMAGMSGTAAHAAREVSPKVPLEVARAVPFIQNAIVLPELTMVTFGRWESVLERPAPDPSLLLGTAMHEYARGTALAALGRLDEARSMLGRLRTRSRSLAAEAGDDETANPVVSIAAHALAGEIALRGGRPAVAAQRFRDAARIEDAMVYEEPPLWYYPIRHSLGRALLEAGEPEAAEVAYREDLSRFPRNGWSLFGLVQSLEAQGRHAEATAARAELEEAWQNADVELRASRF